MGRRGTGTQHRHKPSGRAGRARHSQPGPNAEAAAAACGSDDDLDDELLDYIQNVTQHDNSDDEAEGEGAPSAAAAAAAPAEDDNPDSWRPAGLGYHPGCALAQFAGAPLDHALEGQLARDMQAGSGDSDTSSTSDGTSGDSGDSGSSDSSSEGEEGSEDGEEDAGLESRRGLGACAEPVVVDAAGRQQRWQDLSLQQRFPVQARHQAPPPPAAAGAAGAGTSSSASRDGRQHMQQRGQPSPRELLVDSISTTMLLANRQGSQPAFQSEALSEAVAAATSAAASLARLQVARYAELAQQLQQAKQNPNKRPGRKGKGVKKQLKKHKVAAKRNLREARSDCGALQLLAAVEAFAGSGQGLQVLPPAGSKQKEGFAKQLCRVFGVLASSQGGGSSGRTCLVLQATPDTQAQLSQAGLAQLQQLLRPELAKELAAATIARDDTVATLKKEKKQRRRSSQQGAGMQRQGSRGTPGRAAPAPDYQAPVMFVAAGMLDPNSSLLTHDEYMEGEPEAGGQSDGGADSASEAPTGSGSGSGRGSDAEAAAAEVRGSSSAEVGAFLEALLLQDEGQQQPSAAAPPSAAAAGGVALQQQQQQQQQAGEPAWMIDRAGSPRQAAAGRTGLGFVAAAVAAIEQASSSAAAADLPGAGSSCQQQQQQGAAREPPVGATATTRGAPFAPAWVEDRSPSLQQAQVTAATMAGGAAAGAAGTAAWAGAAAGAGAGAAAAVPAWFEDRGPQRPVYSQRGRGPTFLAAGTADDDFAKDAPHPPPPPPAAAAAGAGDASVLGGVPVYDRAGVGLGFGTAAGRQGLGLGAGATDADQLGQQLQGGQGESDGEGWQQAGLGRRQGRQTGGSGLALNPSQLAQLQAEVRALQVQGGAIVTAGQASRQRKEQVKQQRRQQRAQERQQQRAAMVGGNLDAWMLAAGAAAAAVDAQPTYNMTAQQSKQSKKKKKQRSQRREANRAAAAAGDGGPGAGSNAAGAAGAAVAQGVGFASFEVHTSGIGSRLLSRWGWSEGEGLGRARQGRAEPLRAEQRAKNMGLGYE